MFGKIKLIDMPGIYTANAFPQGDSWSILCGPENQGSSSLVTFPALQGETIAEGPGGVMSLVPFPGMGYVLISVMGLFPPFRGEKGGVYRHTRIKNKWHVSKMLTLPFAHRCDILQKDDSFYLFTATVSRQKENPADWTQPGQVYLTEIKNPCQGEWSAEPVLHSLFRNHGMLKTRIKGEEVLCVSGSEGIFSICITEKKEVQITLVFDKEVSEFTFIDIDGDGKEELITIEPFHGDTLNIYRNDGTAWERIYDASLHFGHGLSAGMMGGRACVATGNRRGDASLELFCMPDGKPQIDRFCIEKGTGTTQTQFFRYRDTGYLLSANQLKNEAALYFLK